MLCYVDNRDGNTVSHDLFTCVSSEGSKHRKHPRREETLSVRNRVFCLDKLENLIIQRVWFSRRGLHSMTSHAASYLFGGLVSFEYQIWNPEHPRRD